MLGVSLIIYVKMWYFSHYEPDKNSLLRYIVLYEQKHPF